MKRVLLILPLLVFLLPSSMPVQALNEAENDFAVSEIPTFSLSSPFDNSPKVKITRLRNNQEIDVDLAEASPGVFQISLKDKTVVTGKYKLEASFKDASSNINRAEMEFTWGKDAPGPKFPKPDAGSYLDLHLKEKPDQKDKEVVIEDANSLGIKQPDGSTRGIISVSPINYQEDDVWKPIDTNLKDKGNEVSGDGTAFSIRKDGSVRANNSTYQEKTTSYGLYNPDTKTYRKISDLPNPKIQGNEYTRENGEFSHTYILGPDSIKEELTFFQKPDLSKIQPEDGDWLVMETEVEGLNLPEGWVKEEIKGDSLFFPLPESKEAKGNKIFTKRFAQKQGNKQYLYTGIAASMLDYLSYPLIIDPTTTLYSDTGDGSIKYVTGVYNTINTAGDGLWIGQQDTGGKEPTYAWERFFGQFSLSGWSTRTIGAADIGIYASSKTGTPTMVLDEIEPFGTLGSEDWAASVTANITTNFGTASPQYNTADIKNRFIISKNDSYIAFRLKRDTEDTQVASNFLTIATADAAGTSTDPKIDITYYENHTQSAVTDVASTSVTVNWAVTGGLTSSDKQEVWYIASATDPGAFSSSTWTKFGTNAAWNATSLSVTGLSSGTKYYFIVRDVQIISSTDYPGSVSTQQNATTTGGSSNTDFSNLDMQGININ